MLNSGQNHWFSVPHDLEIDRWPWKTIGHLLYAASYVNSNWSYNPETAKMDFDLCDLDLSPWPFAWTSLLSLAITSENFMMIRRGEHSERGVTGGQTDGQMGWTIHRAAWSQLNNIVLWFLASARPLMWLHIHHMIPCWMLDVMKLCLLCP